MIGPAVPEGRPPHYNQCITGEWESEWVIDVGYIDTKWLGKVIRWYPSCELLFIDVTRNCNAVIITTNCKWCPWLVDTYVCQGNWHPLLLFNFIDTVSIESIALCWASVCALLLKYVHTTGIACADSARVYLRVYACICRISANYVWNTYCQFVL